MKLKKLFAAALLVCSSGAWAQTDVTSTYLTNADFEGEYSVFVKPNNDRAIYQPTGWTVTRTGSDGNDMSILKSTDLASNNFTAFTINDNTTRGEKTYWTRLRWGNNTGLKLSQTKTLLAGSYTLTALVLNYNQNTSSNKVELFAGSNSVTASNSNTKNDGAGWNTLTVKFSLEEEAEVEIGFRLTHATQTNGEQIVGVDNFQLTWTDLLAGAKSALQEEIDKAKLCDAKEGLATAISTAEGILASATTTAELESALADLQAADKDAVLRYENGLADATAMAPVVTDFVVNGTFDGSDISMWSCNSSFQNKGRKTTDDSNAGSMNNNKPWWENWNGSALVNKMYQTISNIPNGTYRLDITAFVNTLADPNESQYVFANNDKTYLTEAKTGVAYEVWTVVTNNQVEIGLEQTTATANWMGIDNVSLRYYGAGDVITAAQNASHKLAWEEAKAAAEAARDNAAYDNVTGSEKVALLAEIAKAEPNTAQGYDDAAAALTSATSTFTAAKAAYDIFATYNTTLSYADADKKPAITDESTAATIIPALRKYYESHAMAEGVVDAVDATEAVAAANAATNTGWTNGIGTNTGQGFTDGDDNINQPYLDGGWASNAGANIDMTREVVVPAGTYLLTVTARGSSSLDTYTLSIGDETVDLPTISNTGGVFNNGWNDVSVEFESNGKPMTLEIIANSTASQQWISFNRFRLVRLELNEDAYADADDYTALNAAIAVAETKTLGFEKDEYAPYNNVIALEALGTAKAIDQTAELTNFKEDVQAATTALTEATWTANDGDVDAIYNGHFAEANGNNPKGWTRSNDAWGQQITGLEVSTGAETSTAWYYNTNGAWEYGKDGVYTMPLAANQTYELSFKYRKNGNDWQNWMKASVVNGENEGLEVAQFSPADNGTNFVEAKAYFTTGAAGNYILSIEQNGNAHLTDVSLVKVALATLVLSEDKDYAPIDRTYYETVSLTRTVKEGYNTVVLPFDLTAEQVAAVFGEGAKVYSFTETSESADNVAVQFDETATISANVPVLVNATAESTVKNINNVVFKSGEAKVEGANVDFVGVYSSAKVEAGDYFIANSKLYKCTKDDFITIKPFRAYIDIDAPEETNVKFFFGGVEYTDIATALNAIEAAGARSTVFNLAGQRVGKAQKGVYVVGGKKVIIK